MTIELSSSASPTYICRLSYVFFADADSSSAPVTRTLTETGSNPSADAVISAVPSESAVIRPLLTAATDGSEDSQTSDAFLFPTKEDLRVNCFPAASTIRSLLSKSV